VGSGEEGAMQIRSEVIAAHKWKATPSQLLTDSSSKCCKDHIASFQSPSSDSTTGCSPVLTCFLQRVFSNELLLGKSELFAHFPLTLRSSEPESRPVSPKKQPKFSVPSQISQVRKISQIMD